MDKPVVIFPIAKFGNNTDHMPAKMFNEGLDEREID